MTTGAKLVELSSISTGTAMEHLLAISTGSGSVIVDGVDVVLGGGLTTSLADEAFTATLAPGLTAVLEDE